MEASSLKASTTSGAMYSAEPHCGDRRGESQGVGTDGEGGEPQGVGTNGAGGIGRVLPDLRGCTSEGKVQTRLLPRFAPTTSPCWVSHHRGCHRSASLGSPNSSCQPEGKKKLKPKGCNPHGAGQPDPQDPQHHHHPTGSAGQPQRLGAATGHGGTSLLCLFLCLFLS